MIFKIIVALIALRSAALAFLLVKNYLQSKKTFKDFFSHIVIGAADVVIVYVCALYIFRGVL